MPEYSKTVARVALAVIEEGLSLPAKRLTRREKLRVLDVVQRLVEDGHEPHHLIDAARYGMANVWPFNKGQAWDAKDFADNVTKAKAEAARLRRAGRVPTPAHVLRNEEGGKDDG